MRYDRLQTDAQRKAQQRVREVRGAQQLKVRARTRTASNRAGLFCWKSNAHHPRRHARLRLPRLMDVQLDGRYAVHSLPKALHELSQHSSISRSVAAQQSRASLLPPFTLPMPEHIWILAELDVPGSGALPMSGGGAVADGRPTEAAPAAGQRAPPLVERRALAHNRLAIALLRELMRSPAADPPPAAPGTKGGVAGAAEEGVALPAPPGRAAWTPGAGAELGAEAERLDLAFEHLKRMETLLLDAKKQAASARKPAAVGSGARAVGAQRRGAGGSAGGMQPQLDGTRRQELLAVAFSNLAAFYVRRGLPRPALNYCLRAAEEERRLYERVEFSTHLRTAAVLARLSCDQDALSHCEQAWKSFLLCARSVVPEPAATAAGEGPAEGSGAGGSEAGARAEPQVRIEQLPTEYIAAAAVVCCNLSVALVRLGRHVEALEVAQQADEYAALALEPTHEHRQAIAACARYAAAFAEYSEALEESVRPAAGQCGYADEEYDDDYGDDDGYDYGYGYGRLLPSIAGPRAGAQREQGPSGAAAASNALIRSNHFH